MSITKRLFSSALAATLAASAGVMPIYAEVVNNAPVGAVKVIQNLSGYYGNCYWEIIDEILYIRPSKKIHDKTLEKGELPKWKSYQDVPWYKLRTGISGVIVEKGVKAQTCDNMFNGCVDMIGANLRHLDISNAEGIDTIFVGCEKLKKVILPEEEKPQQKKVITNSVKKTAKAKTIKHTSLKHKLIRKKTTANKVTVLDDESSSDTSEDPQLTQESKEPNKDVQFVAYISTETKETYLTLTTTNVDDLQDEDYKPIIISEEEFAFKDCNIDEPYVLESSKLAGYEDMKPMAFRIHKKKDGQYLIQTYKAEDKISKEAYKAWTEHNVKAIKALDEEKATDDKYWIDTEGIEIIVSLKEKKSNLNAKKFELPRKANGEVDTEKVDEAYKAFYGEGVEVIDADDLARGSSILSGLN